MHIACKTQIRMSFSFFVWSFFVLFFFTLPLLPFLVLLLTDGRKKWKEGKMQRIGEGDREEENVGEIERSRETERVNERRGGGQK